jgi:hypothetical protein
MRSLWGAALVAAFMLSGCGTTAQDRDAFIQAIREKAISICGFLPDAEVVAGIILAGNPAYMGLDAIARGICAAVTSPQTKALGPRRAPPMVAGVVIHGRFVRR